MERVKFDVGGRIFAINKSNIIEGPSSRLKKLCLAASDDVIIIDRPPEAFGAIVSMYQTGNLHIPMASCPGAFLEELKYWNIDQDRIARCCYFRLHRFMKEQDTLQTFQKKMQALNDISSHSCMSNTCRTLGNARQKVWTVVDHKDKSCISTIYFFLSILMVIISIMSLALSTDPKFRRPMTNCERLDYMEAAGMEDIGLIENILKSDCHSHELPVSNETVGETDDEGDHDYLHVEVPTTTTQAPTTTTNSENETHPRFPSGKIEFPRLFLVELRRVKIPNITVPIQVIEIVEWVTLIYFSLDLILRLLSCPSLVRYFWSFVNVTDILALLGSYVSFVFILLSPEYAKMSWMRLVQMAQMVRSFRLFKVVVGFNVSKVLGFSLAHNMKDILIMIVYLCAGMCVFSSLLYVVEDSNTITSVPVGMYWAIVTMTTVGYGDIVPRTWTGRIIGSVCAISGVMVFALVVPLVVNHFITLYQYVGFDDDGTWNWTGDAICNKDMKDTDKQEDVNGTSKKISKEESSTKSESLQNGVP